MPLARLKLLSSHGDQTLSRIRFVLHGVATGEQADDLIVAGLPYIEGRPVVSTDLVHSYAQTVGNGASATSRPGKMLVIALPPDCHLGYGILTTAFVDRHVKRVGGAPLRYASARKQLALYRDHDVEAARERTEAEEAEGYPVDQKPGYVLAAEQIIGWFDPSQALQSTIGQIEVAANSFQPVDFERLEVSLNELIHATVPGGGVLAVSVTSDLVVGTIESIIITRMRQMRWQGLKLLGYQFAEGQRDIDIEVTGDEAAHRQNIANIEKLLPTAGLFNGELAWLRDYINTELHIMRLELDEGRQVK